MGFRGFYKELRGLNKLCFTVFYWVLPGFAVFCRVLSGFTRFYEV